MSQHFISHAVPVLEHLVLGAPASATPSDPEPTLCDVFDVTAAHDVGVAEHRWRFPVAVIIIL